MRTKLLWIAMMFLCLFVVGCVESVDTATGETLVSLDPNTIGELQRIGEAGSIVLGILGMIWPFLLPIAGYVGGIVKISRKLTPKLVEAQVEAQMYHTIASSTVLGIEEFKKEYPKEWGELEVKLNELKDKIVKPEDQLRVENIIRGLRGLSPKI